MRPPHIYNYTIRGRESQISESEFLVGIDFLVEIDFLVS